MMSLKSILNRSVFFILAFLVSCQSTPQKPDVEKTFYESPETQSLVRYANGFDLYQKDGITKIVVYHPELSSVVIGTYYIAGLEVSGRYKTSDSFFTSPIDSVALFSATQINAFEKLGVIDHIVGVSEARYLKNPIVKKRIENGIVKELAGSGDFYVETAMLLNPSVIFYSPYKVIKSHPLEVTGIPLIPFYDYRETDPLARAEWIKFSAVFFGLYYQADSIFESIVDQYDHYKSFGRKHLGQAHCFFRQIL